MVGMSKSGSRYGRRSNWFKIHCLLQEQQQQAAQQASGASPTAPAQMGVHPKSPQTHLGKFHQLYSRIFMKANACY